MSTVVAIVAIVTLGIMSTRSAYTNGFSDGVRWMHEGETYPSKPSRNWFWWQEAKDYRRRMVKDGPLDSFLRGTP